MRNGLDMIILLHHIQIKAKGRLDPLSDAGDIKFSSLAQLEGGGSKSSRPSSAMSSFQAASHLT